MPIEVQNAVYVEVREKLDRQWVIDRLMHNVRVAMGEAKSTRSVVLRSRAALAETTVVQIEVFERDGAVANQGLALLLKELDRVDDERQLKADDKDDRDQPAIRRNPALAEGLRRFLGRPTVAKGQAAAPDRERK